MPSATVGVDADRWFRLLLSFRDYEVWGLESVLHEQF